MKTLSSSDAHAGEKHAAILVSQSHLNSAHTEQITLCRQVSERLHYVNDKTVARIGATSKTLGIDAYCRTSTNGWLIADDVKAKIIILAAYSGTMHPFMLPRPFSGETGNEFTMILTNGYKKYLSFNRRLYWSLKAFYLI
jgi:hypothetical protein